MSGAITEDEVVRPEGSPGEGAPTGRRYFLTAAGRASMSDDYRREDDQRFSFKHYTRSPAPYRTNEYANLLERMRALGLEVRPEDEAPLSLFVSQGEAARLLGVTRSAVSARVTNGLKTYAFRERHWVWLPEAAARDARGRRPREIDGTLEEALRAERERDERTLVGGARRHLREGLAGSLDFWEMDAPMAARASAMLWAAMLDGDAVAVMRETGLDYLFVLETVRRMFANTILSIEDDHVLIHADWLDDGLGGELHFVLDAMLLDGLLTLDPAESTGEEFQPSRPAETLAAPPPDGHEAYDTYATYRAGQKLWHRRYGSGAVRRVRDNKIDVLFDDRERTLIHSLKPAAE